MNSQTITELLSIFRGIANNEPWQLKIPEGDWQDMPPGCDLYLPLEKGYQIRLKPFVPEPPEGYRLLTKEEKKGQWIEGAYYWSYMQWLKRPSNLHAGEGCSANKMDHIAVPIEPPAPEYVPWIFETFPRDLRWLRRKSSVDLLTVFSVHSGGLDIYDTGYCPFPWILENMLTEAGEPCGTIKQ